jgi:hypothetical protein
MLGDCSQPSTWKGIKVRFLNSLAFYSPQQMNSWSNHKPSESEEMIENLQETSNLELFDGGKEGTSLVP